VSAPHKKPYTATFDVKGDGTKQTIAIPPLEDEPVAPPPPTTNNAPAAPPPPPTPPPQHPPPPQSSTLRTTGFIVAGAGAAALVTGGVFGVIALQKINDVKKKCPSTPCTDAAAVSDDHTAGTFADVSTVAVSVGAVALAVGTIFVLVSPKHEEAALVDRPNAPSVHPIVGLGTLGLGGSF
jgi:hypothetical protein